LTALRPSDHTFTSLRRCKTNSSTDRSPCLIVGRPSAHSHTLTHGQEEILNDCVLAFGSRQVTHKLNYEHDTIATTNGITYKDVNNNDVTFKPGVFLEQCQDRNGKKDSATSQFSRWSPFRWPRDQAWILLQVSIRRKVPPQTFINTTLWQQSVANSSSFSPRSTMDSHCI
jgi:hypothetical protein